jgi:hypothetical protein
MYLVLFMGKVIIEIAIFSNNIEYKNKLGINNIFERY